MRRPPPAESAQGVQRALILSEVRRIRSTGDQPGAILAPGATARVQTTPSAQVIRREASMAALKQTPAFRTDRECRST